MSTTPFLLGIDVEDPRDDLAHPERFPPEVPRLVGTYLDFLERHRATATFFIVGKVARRHPDVVRRIAAGGHEIACHSDAHVPLSRQDAASLADDLSRNRDSLHAAGAGEISGYRAPCFSLTQATAWTYEVLASLGFRYSSSVLPARNPLHGWPDHGPAPALQHGIVELPVTLLRARLLPVPAGGVYFRALPWPVVRTALADHRRQGRPVLSYLHPYDLDAAQPFAHPAFAARSPFGMLMRANRAAVLPRLEKVLQLGFHIAPYAPFAEALRADLAREAA